MQEYFDAHIHMGLNAPHFADEKQCEEFIRKVFSSYAKKNILKLRDGGDARGISLKARPIAKEFGIDYKTPVYALYKRERYGKNIGHSIGDLDEWKREFVELLKLRPDHLKIPLTGLVSFERYGEIGERAFSLSELKYMISAAHDEGLSVMVHVNGEAVFDALAAGADSIEHGYFLPQRAIEALGAGKSVWVPTLSPLGNLNMDTAPHLKDQLPVIERTYKLHLENISRAHELGAKVLAGSDAATLGVPHAIGFFTEIEHLAKAGVYI